MASAAHAIALHNTPQSLFELRLLVIIVLYKMKPSESPSFRTLQAAIANLPQGKAKIKILLYDNTPGGQHVDIPVDMEYVADPENGGLAKAYNYALKIADKDVFDWLLTLDQDTSLPVDFMCKLYHAAMFVSPLATVAAIVPRVSSDGEVISPSIINKYWPHGKKFADLFIGISSEKMIAINSGSMIKVSALRYVGGYDPRFYLDFSDWAIYHRLQSNGFCTFVAGNIHIEHVLSIFDLKKRSTTSRYENSLRAEEAFCDEYQDKSDSLVLLLKLFYHLIYTIWKKGGDIFYFRVGLKFFCRRLFYSRQHRLREWKQSTARAQGKGK